MKIILALLCASIFLPVYGHAQLMRTINDVQKLKEQEDKFIGRPLKILLREIRPEIRMASAQDNRGDGLPGAIFLKFVDAREYSKKAKEKKYTTVIIYVREKFDWDQSRNSRSPDYSWTKEDEKRFGNLTVVRIGVIGGN